MADVAKDSQDVPKEPPPSENNNSSSNNNNNDNNNSANDGSKKKNKKKKKQNLDDPMKIIEDILEKSSFKVAGLSHIVEKKFYHDPIYRRQLSKLVSDISYLSTVESDPKAEFPTDCVSVLPRNFEGQINVSPSAIMSLSSLEEKPPKRVHYRRGRRVDGADNKPRWTKEQREKRKRDAQSFEIGNWAGQSNRNNEKRDPVKEGAKSSEGGHETKKKANSKNRQTKDKRNRAMKEMRSTKKGEIRRGSNDREETPKGPFVIHRVW